MARFILLSADSQIGRYRLHLEGVLNNTNLWEKLHLVNIPSAKDYYHDEGRHKKAETLISWATALDPERKVLRPLLETLKKIRGAKPEGQNQKKRGRRR